FNGGRTGVEELERSSRSRTTHSKGRAGRCDVEGIELSLGGSLLDSACAKLRRKSEHRRIRIDCKINSVECPRSSQEPDPPTRSADARAGRFAGKEIHRRLSENAATRI